MCPSQDFDDDSVLIVLVVNDVELILCDTQYVACGETEQRPSQVKTTTQDLLRTYIQTASRCRKSSLTSETSLGAGTGRRLILVSSGGAARVSLRL